MIPIEEPVRFYLEHRARIAEWAGLEAEVRKFADRFYRSLEDDVDATLRSGQLADDGVESFFRSYEGGWRGLGLRRPEWPKEDEDPDVRLQWHRGRVRFSDGDHLICGVRTKVKPYWQVFTQEARPRYPHQDELWWPAYQNVAPPVGRFWESDKLKEHRDCVVETLRNAWRDLAPLVDRAVGYG